MFLGGNIFIICLKRIFLDTTKFGSTKIIGVLPTNAPPPRSWGPGLHTTLFIFRGTLSSVDKDQKPLQTTYRFIIYSTQDISRLGIEWLDNTSLGKTPPSKVVIASLFRIIFSFIFHKVCAGHKRLVFIL